MAGEVTSITVVEQTLYNLTITEDDSTVVTVAVPDEIATIEINAYDVSVTMTNVGSGIGPFKAKSIDNFSFRSFVDDDKTIELTLISSDNEIKVKLPDVGISTPDDFIISADSDATANIKMVGGTVDLSKAKLITDLDVNSKDLDNVNLITASSGVFTTADINAGTFDGIVGGTTPNAVTTTSLIATTADINAGTVDATIGATTPAVGTFTTVNATDGTITTLGSTTGNITTVNSTDVNSTNLDVDTGTVDTLTTLDLTATTVDINAGTIDNTTIGATTPSTIVTTDLTATTVDINSGTIDGTTIGSSTSSTGKFSTLESASVDLNGGAIDNITIGATTPSTIVTTNLTATTVDINAGTIDNTVIGATTPVAVTTSSLTATTVDINAGTIDNTVIGATTPVVGTFTTANATTGAITTVNSTTGNITTVNATDVNVSGDLTVSGSTTTINTEEILLADNNIVLNSNHTGTPSQDGGITIERGTSDDALWQWNETTDKWEAKVGSSYADLKVEDVNTNTLTATTGTITNMTSSNVDITGGTIDGVNITNIPAVSFVDLTATTADINGGTIDGTIIGANTSAAVTTTSLVATTADINGGTVDGATIGASSSSTGRFTSVESGALTATTVTASGQITIGGIDSYYGTSQSATWDATGFEYNGSWLGTASKPFARLYVKELYDTEMHGHLIPVQTNTYDLGSASKTFSDAYIETLANTTTHTKNLQPTADSDGSSTGHDLGRPGGSNPQKYYKTGYFRNLETSTISGNSYDSVGGQITGGSDITITNHLIPDTDNTRSLGSSSKQWKSIYVGPGSLYVNGKKVLSDESGAINISTDNNEDLKITTSGTGTIQLVSTNGINVTGEIGTMSGDLQIGEHMDMNSYLIKNVQSPVSNSDAANKSYVDTTVNDAVTDGTNPISGTTGTFSQAVTIEGDLTVNGTTTTVNTSQINISDNILVLNHDATGLATVNAGIEIHRGDDANKQFLWDETDDRWSVGSESLFAGQFIGNLTAGSTGLVNITSKTLITGSAGGLTAPILELETSDNSGWNRPQLMLKDGNGDAASIVGQHHTGGDFYQLNYTLDPNNTHGRTGVTTWAGDYFVGFYKDYSDQSAIGMKMQVYGANDGFNIEAYDDFNSGGGNQYGLKPIRLKGEQVELYADGNERLTVRDGRSTFQNVVKLSNESSDPSGENGDMYYNTTTNKFRGYQNGAWINLDGT